MDMSETPRTKTGIPGLDEALEGGIPRNYMYSVVGAPGTGKTTMGAQFLVRGATQFAENGILVSLVEPTHSIANNMMRFNWNLFDLESQGKICLVDASPRQDEPGSELKIRGGVLGNEKYDLDGLIGTIANARKRVAAKRCVIDSLSSISGAYKSGSEYQFKLLTFIRALSELELTTLILSESDTATVEKFPPEAIIAQGSILLHTIRDKENHVRLFEIQKMRGVRILKPIMAYRINQDGFEVRVQD
jgi:KaiC/GvpD/RAD55 family RecA-like ATPase